MLLTADRQMSSGAPLSRDVPNLAGVAISRGTQSKAYFKVVDRLVKVADSLVPTAVTPVMMTTAIRAAIRPYSMAVAPDSFFRKAKMVLRTGGTPFEIEATLAAGIFEGLTGIVKKKQFAALLQFKENPARCGFSLFDRGK
jgi:hypothetical protein